MVFIKYQLTNTKYDRLYFVKTVDPLLPLRPLAASVEHSEQEVLVPEMYLHHTRGLDPGPQNVLEDQHREPRIEY